MRWVFLVAGFAVGYLLGWSNTDTERSPQRGPAAARTDTPDAQSRGDRSTDPAASAEETAGDQSSDAKARGKDSEDIVEPEDDPHSSPEDDGRVEVHFPGIRGEKTVWAAYRDMRGVREEDDFSAWQPDGLATYENSPGIYEVWWLDGPRRVGTRVRLVKGKVVKLRASDFHGAYIPSHLGVLAIRVHATWGGPLRRAAINVTDGEHGVSVRADQHGNGNVTLRPGRYVIEVGDSRTECVAEAGKETLVEIQPKDEGDILFDPIGWVVTRKIALVPKSRKSTSAFSLLGGTNGRRQGFAYVAAGDYDIVRRHAPNASGGVVLASVRVLARQTNRVALTLPPGTLTLNVEFATPLAAHTRLTIVGIRRVLGDGRLGDYAQAHAARIKNDRRRFRAVLDGLHPGKYRVEWGSPRSAQVVEVGQTPVTFTLRVR